MRGEYEAGGAGTRRVKYEEGSGDVFADLGLPDADERLARSKLGFHVDKLCHRSRDQPHSSGSSCR